MPRQRATLLAGVQFYAVGKVYHFDASQFPELKEDDFVIVETTRGHQIGQVVELVAPGPNTAGESFKSIERVASGRDMALCQYWRSKEPGALAVCQEAASQLDLPIKVFKAEYSYDGTRLLFLYMAEDKLDTQDLKRELAKSFRARIELKLVGPRDAAKLMGGFGACGELRCCDRFLTTFSSISIKMAKEQGISLNPHEITGMCGRLRCCLLYEYEQYVQARKRLPRRGRPVGTPYGQGVVLDVLPLKGAVVAQVGEQQIEVLLEDILPISEPAGEAPPAPDEKPKTRRRRRKK